ncbi:hypothetical protein [Labrys neptuniae]
MAKGAGFAALGAGGVVFVVFAKRYAPFAPDRRLQPPFLGHLAAIVSKTS